MVPCSSGRSLRKVRSAATTHFACVIHEATAVAGTFVHRASIAVKSTRSPHSSLLSLPPQSSLAPANYML